MNKNAGNNVPRQNRPGIPGRHGGMGGLMHVEKPRNTKQTLRRLIHYLGEQWKVLIGVFLMVILSSLLMLSSPAMQKKTLDIVQHGVE